MELKFSFHLAFSEEFTWFLFFLLFKNTLIVIKYDVGLYFAAEKCKTGLKTEKLYPKTDQSIWPDL